MRIEGKQIYLREMTVDDAETLWKLRVRNRAFLEPYEPVGTDKDWTLEAVRSFLKRSVDEAGRDEGYTFGLFRIEDDELVGRIRLSNVFRGPWQNANIGYYVGEEFNGRGYATEAVRLVTTIAFRELGLHRVQAGAMTDNARSIRVLSKAGFRYEGTAPRYLQIYGAWRDHVIYAVTSEEWRA